MPKMYNAMRQVEKEEAARALHELEIKTTFLSEANGYSARRLSVVHRPGRISEPIAYEVRLKLRQVDETDEIVVKEFKFLAEAVSFYNNMK